MGDSFRIIKIDYVQWSPHGLKPVGAPHALQSGTLRSIPHYARMSCVCVGG